MKIILIIILPTLILGLFPTLYGCKIPVDSSRISKGTVENMVDNTIDDLNHSSYFMKENIDSIFIPVHRDKTTLFVKANKMTLYHFQGLNTRDNRVKFVDDDPLFYHDLELRHKNLQGFYFIQFDTLNISTKTISSIVSFGSNASKTKYVYIFSKDSGRIISKKFEGTTQL